eukprot:jgi/Astpho2/1814/fgenesh1_pg.00037_%23_16_t
MVNAQELRDRIDKLAQKAEELLQQGNRDDARTYQEQVKILQKQLDDLTGGLQNEQRQMLLTKEAVREALKEDRESNKTVRVSDVNSEVWNIIQGNAKLELDVFNGTISVTPRQVPAFDWDERLEKTQADRYMPHLNKLMQVRDRSYRLMDANHHPQLLMDGAHQVELGYKFRGTTDVAVVDKVAYQAEEYKHGLRLLFELKKKPDAAATAQAKISLLLANIHSAKLKPVVVLTDLREDYRFYWLDGHTIRVYPAPSSSAAWGLIDLLFDSEEVTEGGVVPKTLDADVMPVAKRQRLVLEGAAAGEGVANLSELEGFLDPQELQASYVLQQSVAALKNVFGNNIKKYSGTFHHEAGNDHIHFLVMSEAPKTKSAVKARIAVSMAPIYGTETGFVEVKLFNELKADAGPAA